MTFLLLNPEIQKFINSNLNQNISKLAFTKNPFPEVKWIDILNQISAKAKAKEKLPTFFDTPNILYPSKVSVEQTSSETTALYKSTLVSGESLIDLTGGFGVDDFYFSEKMKTVIHCEINSELSELVIHNFNELKVSNITCIQGDSTDIIKELNKKFSWIYIDPSRRSDSKGKVFMLKDCLPNVPELLDFYFEYSNNILIKTAPLLDITAGLSELKNVKNLHVVAVENEVKELLWELEKGFDKSVHIKTVNLLKNRTDLFDFTIKTENNSAIYNLPLKYLYEPNNAIMKSGGFNDVGVFYNIEKLHTHSHLYTSNSLIDFPGRIFEIVENIPYNKMNMKNYFENKQFNLTIRNFPDTVENIRKKWKIKEGGNNYCFFTTDKDDNKIVLICKKINSQ
ncbi:MAG TPA: hypothetical protein VN192_01500 [Flavobacterium sp.]|nr:hypothetical protein [Flavobacterium sp.]